MTNKNEAEPCIKPAKGAKTLFEIFSNPSAFKINKQLCEIKNTANKDARGRKSKLTAQDSKAWKAELKSKFGEMNENGFYVGQMHAFLMASNPHLIKIGRTCFYENVMKSSGYTFKKPTVRFGVFESYKKHCSRQITSILIAELMLIKDVLYFYDEITFTMNDFKAKYWCCKSDPSILSLRNPSIRIKLNVLISCGHLVAFQLTNSNHKKDDVIDFISRVMTNEAQKKKGNIRKYLVLDNSPKNRSKSFLETVTESHFGLIFITPGTPDQNMCENFFMFLKKSYRRLNLLARINRDSDAEFEAVKIVSEAMRQVETGKWNEIKRTFINGLRATID